MKELLMCLWNVAKVYNNYARDIIIYHLTKAWVQDLLGLVYTGKNQVVLRNLRGQLHW